VLSITSSTRTYARVVVAAVAVDPFALERAPSFVVFRLPVVVVVVVVDVGLLLDDDDARA
jgi:hypothetical protein